MYGMCSQSHIFFTSVVITALTEIYEHFFNTFFYKFIFCYSSIAYFYMFCRYFSFFVYGVQFSLSTNVPLLLILPNLGLDVGFFNL